MFRSLGRLLAPIMVLVTACSPAAPSSGAGSPPAPATDSPKRGGNLIAGMWLDVASLDPIRGDALATDRYWYNMLYDPLITQDKSGTLKPVLAQSVDMSADGKVITLKLRPGVTFHDGTPVNAEAVKFSIDRVRDPKNESRDRTKYNDVEAIETPDASTVIVKVKGFSADVLEALSTQAGMPVSPAAVQKSGADFGRNPVGTGPFTFVEWVVNDHITVKRNPSYWQKAPDGQSLPYLNQITTRVIPSDAQRLIELRSGSMQADSRIPARDVQTIDKNPEIKVENAPSTNVHFAAINIKAGALANQKVREAVAMAINRDDMNKALFFNRGYNAASVLNKDEWAFDDSLKAPAFDVAKSKALLAEAGYATGFKTSMLIVQRDPDTQIAQVIQQQLKAVGIEMEIEGVERTAFLERVKANDASYGFALSFNAQPQGEPAGRLRGLLDGSYTNKMYPEAKELLDRVVTLPNPAERKTIYTRLQKLFLDDATRIYLVQVPQVIGYSSKLRDIQQEPFGPWIFTSAWLSE